MSSSNTKRIYVQKEKCNGCRICELRCSFEHEGVFSPTLSRIRIIKKEIEGIAIPRTCILCGKCEAVCPERAIVFSPKTGAIEVIEEKCTACGECVKVCPLSVIKIHPQRNVAFTCDLCDGDPQCVKYCPEEALHYITLKEFKKLKEQEKKTKKERIPVIP
ncbi:MAG: 4Fe-4S dicluster domain-containing protein [Candidatus Heimdallarchaeaceae archaeon]